MRIVQGQRLKQSFPMQSLQIKEKFPFRFKSNIESILTAYSSNSGRNKSCSLQRLKFYCKL